MSLFEGLAGEVAVDAAVERFYSKVLPDERIKRFSEGVEMERQGPGNKRPFSQSGSADPAIIRGVQCEPHMRNSLSRALAGSRMRSLASVPPDRGCLSEARSPSFLFIYTVREPRMGSHRSSRCPPPRSRPAGGRALRRDGETRSDSDRLRVGSFPRNSGRRHSPGPTLGRPPPI
jgi:hypothetical protein